jgi:hypothetical protein
MLYVNEYLALQHLLNCPYYQPYLLLWASTAWNRDIFTYFTYLPTYGLNIKKQNVKLSL